MKNLNKLSLALCLGAVALALAACSDGGKDFIKVNQDGVMVRQGEPYYFIGANFWYGAILASEGEGGDRERLHAELDQLHAMGVDNLRILVGADGKSGVETRVEPTLQTAPGVYNEELLDGLDYLMNELRLRGMTAVLYLTNAWEWSGGYSVYLEWAGMGEAVVPAKSGWDAYFNYVKQFPQNEEAKKLYAKHVKKIVKRKNKYNGLRYTEDATLMAWEIANEPRAFGYENKEAFAEWIAQTAAQIKKLDKHHMVAVGSEGSWGCENVMALYEQIHADPTIDYRTFHIWPLHW